MKHFLGACETNELSQHLSFKFKCPTFIRFNFILSSKIGFFIISSQRSKIEISKNLISYFWERIENTGNGKTAEQNVTKFFEVYQHLFLSTRFKHTQALRFIGEAFYHIL